MSYHVLDRVEALEAFRILVAQWPGAPSAIHQSPPLTRSSSMSIVVGMERMVATWYLQMFWENAGRAATVPRMHPS